MEKNVLKYKGRKFRTMDTARQEKRKRALTLALTILINLAIVGCIAVREFGSQTGQARQISTGDIRPVFLLAAVGCFFLALGMEYVKYRRMLMALAGQDDRRGALHCAILGKYYDNITPLGAGGQPFQIYYLKKRGFSTGVSSAAPIAGFLVLQIAYVLVAAVVFITNYDAVSSLPVIRAGAYIGLAFYAFIPLCIISFAVLPKPFEAAACAVTRFLGRLHILKNGEKTAEKLFDSLNAYIASLRGLMQRKFFFLRMLVCSVIYQIAVMSVPYFVLRAFGGGNDWWTVFSLVVYIYAAITIIPTPGNAGAAEGSFYAVFSTLEGSFLFWGMILWRALVYYSWLVAGLWVIARSGADYAPARKKPVPASGALKIALFSDLFYPAVDGVIRTVDAYAKRMSAGESYACVVCPQPGDGWDEKRGYDVLRAPSLRIPGFAFAVPLPLLTGAAKKLFQEKQFDVFHVHSPFFMGELAIRLGRRLNVPVVATFHSKYYDDALHITHSRLLARILASRVVDFYSRVDEVWACSKSTAETLRSYGYRGDIRVMENGADPLPGGDARVLSELAAGRFGISDDKPVLLFVGQQVWQKNLRLVLDTAKRLLEDGWEYTLVITGAGYHGEEIKKYARSLGLEKYVIFTGSVTDRALLYGLYYRAELFFFPSLYDNAPLVLREAALAGLPALLSEGSNAAEAVTDGYNGYTAEAEVSAMAEKIEEVLASGELETVGARARGTIPVSWDAIVEAVIAAYRGNTINIQAGA